MDSFIDKIKKQLKLMTDKEKDAWILSQAKILPTWKQEDFYKSICGTKKVINMPERDDITAFCERVRNGDISVKYETHYVEFDDYGHFHDDCEDEFMDLDMAVHEGILSLNRDDLLKDYISRAGKAQKITNM